MQINPHDIKIGYKKFSYPNRGIKFYMATFHILGTGSTKMSRRAFRTATRAHDYGVRVVARWIRLYDAIHRAEQILA